MARIFNSEMAERNEDARDVLIADALFGAIYHPVANLPIRQDL